MKKNNEYKVFLTNHQGCSFDSDVFTSLRTAKKWASGRGETFDFGKWHKYNVQISKNGEEFLNYYTR